MMYFSDVKKMLVTLAVAVLAGCSNSPTTVKSTTVDPATVAPSSLPTNESTWQQAYGQAQEINLNVIGDEFTAAPVVDVWQRIRNGFVMTSASPLHADTKKQLAWFVKHPEYVAKVVERSRPYLHHIVSEIDKRNMPMEIALLPVVESGFQPFAYSKSRAAGLWQFIPSTGKVYGLKQNWWYDGRRDVIASTDAALNYLQKLHNDFGDWQLALAAYNCGEGTVGRAIKRNKRLGKATDFWSLDLPKETSAYVPKLMAISHLIAQPERYKLSLSPIDNKPFLKVVDIGSQIDLALAAKLAGITSDEIYQLNPGFNHWATLPEGPHKLVVPIAKAEQFQRSLSALPEKERMQWARHKIKSGESLGVIAKRYKTTVAVLKEANSLGSNTIREGRHLLIPVASGTTNDYALTAQQRQQTSQNKRRKGKKSTHIVRAGDTWWDIARSHDIEVRQLTGWNNKAPADTLHLGQKLVVWSKKNTTSSNNQVKSISYKIRSGDSLWKISQKFNVSVAQVREWNGLSKRTLIKPGQTLTLFVNAT